MAEQTPPSPSRFQRATRWYGYVSDILTPGRIGLLLGAAVLGVVGIFGGWDAVSDAAEDMPTVEV